MSAKPNLLAEAKELLRNAAFADGFGTVFTQDCEALEAAVKYEETQARGTRKLVEALQAASEQLNRQYDYDAVLNMRSKAPDGDDYNQLYRGVWETRAIVYAALAECAPQQGATADVPAEASQTDEPRLTAFLAVLISEMEHRSKQPMADHFQYAAVLHAIEKARSAAFSDV